MAESRSSNDIFSARLPSSGLIQDYTSTVDPTFTDTADPGSFWVNETTNVAWIAESNRTALGANATTGGDSNFNVTDSATSHWQEFRLHTTGTLIQGSFSCSSSGGNTSFRRLVWSGINIQDRTGGGNTTIATVNDQSTINTANLQLNWNTPATLVAGRLYRFNFTVFYATTATSGRVRQWNDNPGVPFSNFGLLDSDLGTSHWWGPQIEISTQPGTYWVPLTRYEV